MKENLRIVFSAAMDFVAPRLMEEVDLDFRTPPLQRYLLLLLLHRWPPSMPFVPLLLPPLAVVPAFCSATDTQMRHARNIYRTCSPKCK